MIKKTISILILFIPISYAFSYTLAKDTTNNPEDTVEFMAFIDPYPLVIDKLSDTLSIEDSIFLDELIITDSAFNSDPIINYAYVYKNADFTFYIEYYFKTKTITYFVCEGYIRKRQIIKYENKIRNPRRNR